MTTMTATTTITVPKSISTLLEQKAARLQISVEALTAKLLSEALADEASELSEVKIDENFPTLAEIVAGIKALPPNPKSIQRAERAHDLAYIDWLLANPPTDTLPFEEWNRLWTAFEQELKAVDRANDIAEGRL